MPDPVSTVAAEMREAASRSVTGQLHVDVVRSFADRLDARPAQDKEEIEPAGHAHGYVQWIRGMCSDELPHTEIDAQAADAVERIKAVERERDALRAALDDYRSNPSRGGRVDGEGSSERSEPMNEVVGRSDYRDKEERA